MVKKGDLQIEDDGLLTSEDGGRVRQEGVEDAEVAGVDLDAVHDGVLVHVENSVFPRGVHQNPAPRTPHRSYLLLGRRLRQLCRDDVPLPSHL